jgi:hypothetical protein
VLGASCPNATTNLVQSACSPVTVQCTPSQTITGPDHHIYRVDTYVLNDHPIAASRTVRKVTIVVRDGKKLSKVLARSTSTFDCSTALPYGPGCPTS